MSEQLLEEIQKSIYVALESADAATDAVKELGRIKHEVLESGERMVEGMQVVQKRTLLAAGSLSAFGIVVMLSGAFMLFSTQHEFDRIAEVSRASLKAYITDINALRSSIEQAGATKDQLEALTAALGAQQRETGLGQEQQRKQLEALLEDIKSQQAGMVEAVEKLTAKAATPAGRAAPAARAAPAGGSAELAAISERLRALTLLVERLPRSSPAAASNEDARILEHQRQILAAMRELVTAQNATLQTLTKRQANLSYP